MELSILCVTQMEPHALAFLDGLRALAGELGAELVIGADGSAAATALMRAWPEPAPYERVYQVQTGGYVEQVLDDLVRQCRGDYVLRLDDDERPSPAMRDWLLQGQYRTADHWAFPRANLWGDAGHFIAIAPLWPDMQTRLSVRSKAGGRHAVHEGSPFGTGQVAPVVLEHHKFLMRARAEREAIARRYEQIQPGAGSGHYRAFSVPEEDLGFVPLAKLGDGVLTEIDVRHPAWVTA